MARPSDPIDQDLSGNGQQAVPYRQKCELLQSKAA